MENKNKVKLVNKNYTFTNFGLRYCGECPTCGYNLDISKIYPEKYDKCPNCNQKIKWKESEY